MNRKAGNGDSARKALGISQHTPPAPNLFTGPGVAVNAWQTPESQRYRKPLCSGTCNPFIQLYMFIFWFFCITCLLF